MPELSQPIWRGAASCHLLFRCGTLLQQAGTRNLCLMLIDPTLPRANQHVVAEGKASATGIRNLSDVAHDVLHSGVLLECVH